MAEPPQYNYPERLNPAYPYYNEYIHQSYPKGVSLYKLFLGDADEPELKEGDELAVTYPHYYVPYRQDIRFQNSIYSAGDAMDRSSKVGFLQAYSFDDFRLPSIVYETGIVVPRKTEADKQKDLVKLSCVILLISEKGNTLLLPRRNKTVLSHVFTVPIMESITFDDIQIARKSSFSRGRSHYEVSFDYSLFWSNLIRRAVNEECVVDRGLLSHPFVIGELGGGKDRGFTFGYLVKDEIIDKIAKERDGIIFNAWDYDYGDVTEYWGGKVDGWTESIMKWAARYFPTNIRESFEVE